MNFIIKLPHLAYHAIPFKQDLVGVPRFVVILCHVSVINSTFQDLPTLVELGFFWPVVNSGGFTDHEIGT